VRDSFLTICLAK